MKRREFIKSSALLGSSVSLSPGLVACGEKQKIEYLKENQLGVTVLQRIENNFLKVSLYSDASAEIIDKSNDVKWEIGNVAIQEYGPIEEGHVWLINDRSMVQQYPGRFLGKKLKNNLFEFILYGKQNRIRGSFKCEIVLEDEWLKYNIVEISEDIQSLVFPPPVKSDSIIFPHGIGEWNKNKEKGGIYTRRLRTFWTHLNMRFIGGQKNDAAWICIFEDGFEDACTLEANNTITPVFMRTLDKWEHSYSVKYSFFKGNYVNVAKKYRKYFQEKGLFKSLDEKIEANRDLAKIKGGRGFWMTLARGIPRKKDIENNLMSHRLSDQDVDIRFTYQQAQELIEKYRQFGMKKGFVKIAGWINKGYDWSHPDVWPPEPKLGEINELREIMEMGGDILTGLHDNYMDMYEGLPSWPKGVIRQRDGSYMTGGFWAGGQAYIMHYKESLKYARRNWEKIKSLNPKSMFCDTVTAMQLYQSFEKGNKLTKRDDYLAKIEFMKFYKDQGQVFGSEEVADFGIPYVDWFETRFRRDEETYLPLWLLVFHDAAFIMRYGSSGVGGDYPKWLEDMLWGTNLHFHSRKNFDEKYFKSTFHVDEWNEKVGTAEMVNHKFLTEDHKIEQTEFSAGYSIIVNFSDSSFSVQGKEIKAKNYLILS